MRSSCSSILLGLILATHCVWPARAESNWPQFRGADASGVVENTTAPVHWTATENVLWKQPLPGRGWSSPIVWQDRVYLTTVVNLGEPGEPPKRGLYLGGERKEPSGSKMFLCDSYLLWSNDISIL